MGGCDEADLPCKSLTRPSPKKPIDPGGVAEAGQETRVWICSFGPRGAFHALGAVAVGRSARARLTKDGGAEARLAVAGEEKPRSKAAAEPGRAGKSRRTEQLPSFGRGAQVCRPALPSRGTLFPLTFRCPSGRASRHGAGRLEHLPGAFLAALRGRWWLPRPCQVSFLRGRGDRMETVLSFMWVP